VDLSSALGFDYPRTWLKDILGRGSDDTVDAKVTFYRPRKAPVPTSSVPALFTPTHPLRVYITGDSLITDPGSSFLQLAQQSGVIKSLGLDPHAATGLAQPEIFNWFDFLPVQAKHLRPDLVVITLGGNDGLDLSGSNGGQSFGSPAWDQEYGRRVGGVMDDFISYGAKVIWVGLPITRDSSLAAHYRTINAVAQQQANLRSGNVVFLDLYRRFEDKNGSYSDYLPGVNGQLVHVRAADGIHYDTPGADIVAHEIAQAIAKLFRLQTNDPDFGPNASG
jgi:hypothetical protein